MTTTTNPNYEAATAAAHQLANDLGQKGFRHAFNVVRFTYDTDKRTGKTDPENAFRMHISDFAKLAGVSTPTIKNYRIGYAYAVSTAYGFMPHNPDSNSTWDASWKGDKFSGKAWRENYAAARDAFAEVKRAEKAETASEVDSDLEDRAANGDVEARYELAHNTVAKSFKWIGEAKTAAAKLAEVQALDLTVEQSAALVAELNELSTLVYSAAKNVEKLAAVTAPKTRKPRAKN